MVNLSLNSFINSSDHPLKIKDLVFFDEVLSEKNLGLAVITQSVFNNITFDKIKLEGVLSGCQFNNCTFDHSDLKGVEVDSCYFQNCIFNNSSLVKSEFISITFYSCKFKSVSYSKAYFEDCRIINTKFEDIDYLGLCPIIENSIISTNSKSLSFFGSFNFYHILEFLKKARFKDLDLID